jgi:hypothetical protein
MMTLSLNLPKYWFRALKYSCFSVSKIRENSNIDSVFAETLLIIYPFRFAWNWVSNDMEYRMFVHPPAFVSNLLIFWLIDWLIDWLIGDWRHSWIVTLFLCYQVINAVDYFTLLFPTRAIEFDIALAYLVPNVLGM